VSSSNSSSHKWWHQRSGTSSTTIRPDSCNIRFNKNVREAHDSDLPECCHRS
jgi:hypothetical protein